MQVAIAGGAASPLHAALSVLGRIAQEAGVERLLLGHIGQFNPHAAVAEVKQRCSGALTVGADPQCTPMI